jgi:RNA polymerase sigma-70 factor (ECF subfamily)
MAETAVTSDDSLDRQIERMNNGESDAVEPVLMAMEPYLRIAVRRRLDGRLRSKVDSADIVQSVFVNVITGFRNGGWRFAGRPQLRAFLRRIASRRIADRYHQQRGMIDREQPLDEAAEAGLPRAGGPRPSQVAEGREFLDRALRTCTPAQREVVRLRMSGYQMAEIAERTGLHEGSVRRILYDLARRMSVSRRPGPKGPGLGGPEAAEGDDDDRQP